MIALAADQGCLSCHSCASGCGAPPAATQRSTYPRVSDARANSAAAAQRCDPCDVLRRSSGHVTAASFVPASRCDHVAGCSHPDPGSKCVPQGSNRHLSMNL